MGRPRESSRCCSRRRESGDGEARDRLTRAVYGELRQMAGAMMRRERPGHTLQPSALVNEAIVRLFEGEALERARTAAICSPPRRRRCGRCWSTSAAA